MNDTYQMPSRARLTVGHLLAGTSVTAVALAAGSLPWAVALGETVLAALVLHLIGLPALTDRGGAWGWAPWAVWCLSLAACPVAMGVVSEVYAHTGPPLPGNPSPWPVRLVNGLLLAHAMVSAGASVAVVVLTRRWWERLASWAVVLVAGGVAFVMAFGATMAVAGWAL